jgi:hypothetical protein
LKNQLTVTVPVHEKPSGTNQENPTTRLSMLQLFEVAKSAGTETKSCRDVLISMFSQALICVELFDTLGSIPIILNSQMGLANVACTRESAGDARVRFLN